MLEPRQHYPLAGLARSTFYYQQRTLQREDKYADLKLTIRELFDRHKGRYDYRRITAAIRRSGDLVTLRSRSGCVNNSSSARRTTAGSVNARMRIASALPLHKSRI